MKRFLTFFAIAAALFVNGCGNPESSLKKARDLAARGRHAEAVESFQAALKKPAGQPWISSAWLDLARSQKQLGKSGEAKAAAGTALDTAQNDGDRAAAALFLAELQLADREFSAAASTLGRGGPLAQKDPRYNAA